MGASFLGVRGHSVCLSCWRMEDEIEENWVARRCVSWGLKRGGKGI